MTNTPEQMLALDSNIYTNNIIHVILMLVIMFLKVFFFVIIILFVQWQEMNRMPNRMEIKK